MHQPIDLELIVRTAFDYSFGQAARRSLRPVDWEHFIRMLRQQLEVKLKPREDPF